MTSRARTRSSSAAEPSRIVAGRAAEQRFEVVELGLLVAVAGAVDLAEVLGDAGEALQQA